jgi:hypothetical protein
VTHAQDYGNVRETVKGVENLVMVCHLVAYTCREMRQVDVLRDISYLNFGRCHFSGAGGNPLEVDHDTIVPLNLNP